MRPHFFRVRQIDLFRTVTTLSLIAIVLPGVVHAQATTREPATGKTFPTTVSFEDQGKTHRLALTGIAVRTKFFLNVYAMGHYMENAPIGSFQAVIRAVLADESAKQVTMDFVRSMGAERIQNALLEGFRKNSSDAEFEEIRPSVRKFARSIHQDIRSNDQFIIRWLPGGRTISLFQDKEIATITDVKFARILWSIWFGEQSVVDRTHLVNELTVSF